MRGLNRNTKASDNSQWQKWNIKKTRLGYNVVQRGVQKLNFSPIFAYNILTEDQKYQNQFKLLKEWIKVTQDYQ